MWIFTKYGFFSAVCARVGDGRQSQRIDPERVMIRARLKKHLQDLKSRFGQLLGAADVLEFSGTDYAFRIVVEKSVWCQVVSELAAEIDYGNFKSEVARHQGLSGVPYERSLHKIWSIMYGLQEEA